MNPVEKQEDLDDDEVEGEESEATIEQASSGQIVGEGDTKEEEKPDPRDFLTHEQVDYFRNIFLSFDTEKKDKVPTKVIGFVLRLMGQNPSKAEIKEHINEIDPENKGVIDFQKFLLPIAERITQEPENHEDIIAAFRVFDEDNNGYVMSEVLAENLMNLSEDLDDIEMELLLKMAETKGTGKIYYVEFVEKLFGIIRKQSKKEKGEKKKGKKKKGKK